jgi:hypothetical protein
MLRHLTEELGKPQSGWKVVWVSSSVERVTRQYCEEQHLQLDHVVWDPTYSTYRQLGLDAVPNIISVNSSGIVQRVWRGKLDALGWKDVAQHTGVSYQSIIGESAALTQERF